jgi:hypothetical protein
MSKITIGEYTDLDVSKKYIITSKYPYVLKPIYKDLTISAVIYNWRIASKFADVLSMYSRLKQMDPTIPAIDSLVFIVFKDNDFNEVILADYWIEDITMDIDSLE